MKKWILISALALSAIVCNLTAPNPTSAPPTLNVDAASTIVAAASASAAAQITATLVTTPIVPEMGTITGKLSYPAESLPPMRVTAFAVNSDVYLYIDTLANQPTYTFDLPVGTYHIVAYSIATDAFPGGIASGYTRAVLCGLAPECADHSLIEVTITAGTTIPDINPGDAYAPDGTFPPMPGGQ